MWYVMQTMTGKEEELACMVKKVVSPGLQTGCFTAYYERVWRRQRQSIVHIEKLFPGYVFVATDNPKHLFLELRNVPVMSRLLSDGNFDFLPLGQEEETFLHGLLQDSEDSAAVKIARLSYVETDGNGHVCRISGPLENYMDKVVKYQFKKRYAVIRFQMIGMERTAALGIILREDVRQGIAYGNVEAPIKVPALYEAITPDVLERV